VKVDSIMSTKVVSISADDKLDIVKDIMELASVRHLPVVRLGRLVGVVTQRDLLKASLSTVMGLPASEHTRFLRGISIEEVMSAPPHSIEVGATVQEAARVMSEYKIGCLPVVDGDALVGILTETDLLSFFAQQDVEI